MYLITFQNLSELFQAFEEHSEILKARDAMIAALQSSLSAKDSELEVHEC